jgi:hypothetical protein
MGLDMVGTGISYSSKQQGLRMLIEDCVFRGIGGQAIQLHLVSVACSSVDAALHSEPAVAVWTCGVSPLHLLESSRQLH